LCCSRYFLCFSMYFCIVYVCFVSFSLLFVCICLLCCCNRVATQLQLNISYHNKPFYRKKTEFFQSLIMISKVDHFMHQLLKICSCRYV
jgi:hypothetical protein